MKNSNRRSAASIGVLLASLVGCMAPPETEQEMHASAAPDGFFPGDDGARPFLEANVRFVYDGGTPELVIGTPEVDAGTPEVDAGTPEVDAGTPEFDAGIDSGVDAGRDAGIDGGADAGRDAGTDAGVDAGIFLANSGLIYPGNRTQSPINAALAQRLRNIAASGTGQPRVFSKVGDSISTNQPGLSGGRFLNCFDGNLEGTVSWEYNVRMGPWSSLTPTISYFQSTQIGSDNSWTRASLCTMASRTASWAITGSPSPLEQELAAANPRYAVVMYGSNDIGYLYSSTLAEGAERYERNMRTLTDQLLARGVIPLLTTMPPDGDFFEQVPVFAGVVRAIAQGRQIPLIDYYRELMALGPPYGLASDNVHPTCANYNTCCWFDSNSLSQHGFNVRNLITLQALDRMRQVFEQNANFDPTAPQVSGTGAVNSPFVIQQVPFGELRDLRTATSTISGTPSCPGAPAVSGRQNLYRLELTRTTSLRVLVVDGGARAQRVSLLSSPRLSSCLRSDPRLISTTLAAGTYYLSINALSPSGGGEYNLSVTECLPGDPGC